MAAAAEEFVCIDPGQPTLTVFTVRVDPEIRRLWSGFK